MRTCLFLLITAVLAACAPTGAIDVPDDHPASTDVPASHYAVEASPLDPAPQPDVPDALRSRPQNHGSMEHGEEAMDHGEHAGQHPSHPAPPSTPNELADALDAYIAIQSALAADRLDGLRTQARAFVTSVEAIAETPPADDPHFWHERADDLDAILTYADALGEADDLADARVAFGHLSAPFADLAEALGLPDDVARFRCGMFDDAPDGGVWLQRGDGTQNPYFGAEMLTCGTETRVMSRQGHGDAHHDLP